MPDLKLVKSDKLTSCTHISKKTLRISYFSLKQMTTALKTLLDLIARSASTKKQGFLSRNSETNKSKYKLTMITKCGFKSIGLTSQFLASQPGVTSLNTGDMWAEQQPEPSAQISGSEIFPTTRVSTWNCAASR